MDEKELSPSNYYAKNDIICDPGFEMKTLSSGSLCGKF